MKYFAPPTAKFRPDKEIFNGARGRKTLPFSPRHSMRFTKFVSTNVATRFKIHLGNNSILINWNLQIFNFPNLLDLNFLSFLKFANKYFANA